MLHQLLAAGSLPAKPLWPMLSSLLWGLAVFVFVRTLRNALDTDDLQQDDQWRYDVTRINGLRAASPMYRFMQPVFDLLARLNARLFSESLTDTFQQMQAAGVSRFWTATEYLARMQIVSAFLGVFYLYLCTQMFGSVGWILAVALTGLQFVMLRFRLASQARYRLFQIKKRMPFLLDLLTLLMEAGSTFVQALTQAVNEFEEHPVGIEFGRVLAELKMGKSRTGALESMRDRLNDDEVTSIIGSIVQGENLGTPLATIFRTQADVLRIKRTQRAETLAGEAGVKMLAPAVLVMAATVIVILGPFLLSFIYADFLT